MLFEPYVERRGGFRFPYSLYTGFPVSSAWSSCDPSTRVREIDLDRERSSDRLPTCSLTGDEEDEGTISMVLNVKVDRSPYKFPAVYGGR